MGNTLAAALNITCKQNRIFWGTSVASFSFWWWACLYVYFKFFFFKKYFFNSFFHFIFYFKFFFRRLVKNWAMNTFFSSCYVVHVHAMDLKKNSPVIIIIIFGHCLVWKWTPAITDLLETFALQNISATKPQSASLRLIWSHWSPIWHF